MSEAEKNQIGAELVLAPMPKTGGGFRSARRAETASRIAIYVVLTVLCIIWLYPILWVVLSAFRVEYNDNGQLIGIIVSNYFPKGVGFKNFELLFTTTEFARWLLNTIIVSVCTCVLSTLLNLSVSYIMSKMRFKMRKPFMNIAIIMGLFPGFMSLIAVYYILKALALTKTLFALILVYSAGAGLGFYVGKGFFDTIPNSMLESARIDGANNATVFAKIILPLSKPIVVYTALMAFMGPWMDFIFARLILGEQNVKLHTVAVGLYYMMYGQKVDSNVFTIFCAGCLIIAIMIISLFMSMQKYYVEGATAGSVKG